MYSLKTACQYLEVWLGSLVRPPTFLILRFLFYLPLIDLIYYKAQYAYGGD
jgi:hypothetical protein